MRKSMTALFAVVVVSVLAGAVYAGDKKDKKDEKPAAAAAEKKEAAAPAAGDEGPEFIMMEKAGKMAPVKFPHKVHAEKAGGCAACHEGKEPLFAQKRSEEGMKMADMYAGKGCGSCHDGKKEIDGKKVFAAKGGCMKCHKK